MTQTTALAKKKTVETWLTSDSFTEALRDSMPKHLTADRFVRIALTSMIKAPLLRECSQESLFNALLTLSQLGIEPDGRRAHLIPFRNNQRGGYDVQLIVDYKGLVELAMRSGRIASIHADVVCDNDTFEYDRGQVIHHKIDWKRPRGTMYAAYAMIHFKDQGVDPKCEVMSKDEVDAIRERSKAKAKGPWVTDYNEMAKKTVFRRATKWIELSPEMRDAIDSDSDMDPIQGARLVPEAKAGLFSDAPAPTTEPQTGTVPAETTSVEVVEDGRPPPPVTTTGTGNEKSKRPRRTKAQMEEARRLEAEQKAKAEADAKAKEEAENAEKTPADPPATTPPPAEEKKETLTPYDKVMAGMTDKGIRGAELLSWLAENHHIEIEGVDKVKDLPADKMDMVLEYWPGISQTIIEARSDV